MRILIAAVITLLTLPTASCGLLSSQGSDTTQTQEVVADNATVTSTSESRQVSSQSKGASVEGTVEDVITNNNQGISPMWFMIGALVLGMVIPQPKFLKIFW